MDKKERMSIARKFTEKVLKKYGPMIKSVVVFGSSARGDFKEDSDIDIFIIYDDLFLSKYHITPSNFESDLKRIGKDISNFIRISTPWSIIEFIRAVQIGSPILINILRDGWALYDSGIFINVKNHFEKGNIRWTFELINNMIISSRENFKNFERSKIKIIVEDIYYGLVNLMIPILHLNGIEIISFSEINKHLKSIKNLSNLNEKEEKILKKIIKIRNEFEYGRLKGISNKEFYEIVETAQEIKNKFEKCEEKLYNEAIEKRKTELLKKIKKLGISDGEIVNSIKDSKSWIELDKIEAYIYLIENR